MWPDQQALFPLTMLLTCILSPLKWDSKSRSLSEANDRHLGRTVKSAVCPSIHARAWERDQQGSWDSQPSSPAHCGAWLERVPSGSSDNFPHPPRTLMLHADSTDFNIKSKEMWTLISNKQYQVAKVVYKTQSSLGSKVSQRSLVTIIVTWFSVKTPFL